jgi:hypothetical protein
VDIQQARTVSTPAKTEALLSPSKPRSGELGFAANVQISRKKLAANASSPLRQGSFERRPAKNLISVCRLPALAASKGLNRRRTLSSLAP